MGDNAISARECEVYRGLTNESNLKINAKKLGYLKERSYLTATAFVFSHNSNLKIIARRVGVRRDISYIYGVNRDIMTRGLKSKLKTIARTVGVPRNCSYIYNVNKDKY